MMGKTARAPYRRWTLGSLLTILLSAMTWYGCSGGDDLCTGPFCFSPPTQPEPSTIEAGPNNGQHGIRGRRLEHPMSVRVKDSNGRAVSGVTVHFTVSTGGGSLSSATAESNVDGLAQVDWTLGQELGTQLLHAAAENDGEDLAGSPVELTATADPPQPDHLVLRTTLAETAQNGVPLDPQPVIEVYDADNQLLPQVEVIASAIPDGGATVTGGTTATSDAEGLATFTNLALVGPQGPQTLRFSVATPGPEVLSAPIQLIAGNAASMTAVAPTSYEATVNSPVSPGPSVLVKDEAGNPAPGVSVSFTANRNASVSPETAVTNEQGVAQVSWTLGSTANIAYTLTARIESSAIEPVRFTARALPGSAGRLRIAVQPSSPTASGSAFASQPVIQLEDQNGNPTPQSGVRVTATVSSGPSATLQNAVATTDASGRATFSGLSLTGQAGSYTLSFSAPGLVGVTSSPFTVTVGAAARLVVVTAPSALARSRNALVIQPVLQVQDASGNPIRQAGTQVTASITAANTTISGATATTDENGRASFSGLTLTGPPGPKELTFSASGLQSTTARVTLVSVETVSAAPSHPVTAVVGTTVTGPVITWTLRDAATRPVADADFTLVVPSGGTAATLTPFSDANGAVQVGNWTLGTAAGYQYLILRLPDGRTFRDSILATPDSPADLVITSGNDQTAPAGSDLPQPLVVRVVDRYNNGVAGVPVQWATCEGVAGPTVDTDASGYASVTQPTGSEPASGCTRASIAQPAVSVEFHYQVTSAPSQEDPLTGVSAAQSRHSGGAPPVPLRRGR